MEITAQVIKGVQIGAKFGIATANLELSQLPDIEEGVYLVDVFYKNDSYGGLLHFGPRKTFGGDLSAEVHILDFDKDIYDDLLTLKLEKKIRVVKAFQNADALFTQIETDILVARKYFLRQKISTHWKAISLSDQARLAAIAQTRLEANSTFLEAATIFVYAPQLGKEITFVAALMQAYPNKVYAFPRIDNKKMTFYAENNFQALKTDAFGILAPEITEELIPKTGDLMIIPAVAADLKGNRLGQGGGFYDRYLADLKEAVATLIVLPSFAVVEKVPTEKHDKTVDRVVSCEI